MENGQLHDDKLFRAVHDRLSDYEAPSNGADWDAMSRSLDNLPKTSRFQWKISLNAILVILGVTGLSVLGFALANHSGQSNTSTAPAATQTAVKPNPPPQQNIPVATNTTATVNNNSSAFNTQQQANIIPVSNDVSVMNTNSQNNQTATAVNDAANQDAKPRTKKHGTTDLFFGDQIDPKKGFIYHTQEDKNALTPPPAISNPDVFYDVNNGQVTKITLKDSLKKSKTFVSDSTSITNKTAAPVEGGPKGFDDNEGQ